MRGTSTRQPNSGLVSNHDSVSRSATVSPTTVIVGGASLAAFTSAAMFASVDVTVRCEVVVPSWVIATGVSGARPEATSALAASPMPLVEESSTRVALPAPSPAQSTAPSATLTTRTSRFFADVSGMPAYAGTALIAETPGTTSNGMPAFAQPTASSEPVA